MTGFGCSDPPFAAALGGAAGLAPPPDLGSPLALSNTAFSQHSWICQLFRKNNSRTTFFTCLSAKSNTELELSTGHPHYTDRPSDLDSH